MVILFRSLSFFNPWLIPGQKLQNQHALKGQKLLAQGFALSIIAIYKTP